MVRAKLTKLCLFVEVMQKKTVASFFPDTVGAYVDASILLEKQVRRITINFLFKLCYIYP